MATISRKYRTRSAIKGANIKYIFVVDVVFITLWKKANFMMKYNAALAARPYPGREVDILDRRRGDVNW
jgi:hypothetical protein